MPSVVASLCPAAAVLLAAVRGRSGDPSARRPCAWLFCCAHSQPAPAPYLSYAGVGIFIFGLFFFHHRVSMQPSWGYSPAPEDRPRYLRSTSALSSAPGPVPAPSSCQRPRPPASFFAAPAQHRLPVWLVPDQRARTTYAARCSARPLLIGAAPPRSSRCPWSALKPRPRSRPGVRLRPAHTGQQPAAPFGLALLGKPSAWTVVAHSHHAQAAPTPPQAGQPVTTRAARWPQRSTTTPPRPPFRPRVSWSPPGSPAQPLSSTSRIPVRRGEPRRHPATRTRPRPRPATPHRNDSSPTAQQTVPTIKGTDEQTTIRGLR